jgi:hypothetical protein
VARDTDLGFPPRRLEKKALCNCLPGKAEIEHGSSFGNLQPVYGFVYITLLIYYAKMYKR